MVLASRLGLDLGLSLEHVRRCWPCESQAVRLSVGLFFIIYRSVIVFLSCPGCKDAEMGVVLKKLFQTPYFRITVVPDAETVELCGALKVRFTISYY